MARKQVSKKPATKAAAPKKARTKKAVKKKPVAGKPVAKKPAAKKPPTAKKAAAKPSPKERWGKRADLGADPAGYLGALPADLRPLAQRAHDAFMGEQGVTAAIKWGMPVYEVSRTMYGSIWKGKGYIRLGLYTGAEVDDPMGLLEGEGKGHRHMKLRPDPAPPWREIERLIRKSTALARTAR